METVIEKELKTINYFDIPLGKQYFIATIEKFGSELEQKYNPRCHRYYDTNVPYVYFKDVKILINQTWHEIQNIEFPLKSRIGKKIEKLNLSEEDTISFSAKVVSNLKELVGEITLPETYNDSVELEIYETEFSVDDRLSKDNYTSTISVKEFKKLEKKDELFVRCEPTAKKDGFFRDTTIHIWNRELSNLSDIEKY